MNQFRPTLEQAARIQQAVAAASLMTPERAEELQAFEMVCRQTGDGIPEPAMESVINVILGRKEPRHVDDLLANLFGSQPEDMFEAIGQFAAISALMEYLALDLLSTLIDDTPREKYEADDMDLQHPINVLDRCEERAVILNAPLHQEVLRTVKNLRQIRQWRNQYVHTTWSRYAGGWRSPRGPASRLLITEEEEGERLSDLAEEAAQEAVWLRDLIQRCQTEQNRRLAP